MFRAEIFKIMVFCAEIFSQVQYGQCKLKFLIRLCKKKTFFWGVEILLPSDIPSLDSCAGPFVGFVQKY